MIAMTLMTAKAQASYTSLTGQDATGGVNRGRITVETEADCQDACTNDVNTDKPEETCNGYAYNTETGRCYLKHFRRYPELLTKSDFTSRLLSDVNDDTTGAPVEPTTDATPAPELDTNYNQQTGVDYSSGVARGNSVVQNERECQDACTNDVNTDKPEEPCNGYAYNTETGQCYLKHFRREPTADNHPDFNSGVQAGTEFTTGAPVEPTTDAT